MHDTRRVGVPRAIAQFRHDVSFANLNPSTRVTISSRGGARRPPQEAATPEAIISNAISGLPALARASTISNKCAPGGADALPLDHLASVAVIGLLCLAPVHGLQLLRPSRRASAEVHAFTTARTA